MIDKDSPLCDFFGSDGSLNLSRKLPGSIKKSEFGCTNLQKKDELFENKKFSLEKRSHLPTLSKKKMYTKKTRHSAGLVKGIGGTPSLKRLNITQNVKKSALRMVKNFRRRKQYGVLKNLSEYHYNIIGDEVCNPDDKNVKNKLYTIQWYRRRRMIKLMKLLHLENTMGKLMTFGKGLQLYMKKHLPSFDPNNPFNVAWDFIVMTVTFLRIYYYSIEKGFVTNLALEPLDSVLLLVLFLDIGVKLNTKVYKEGIQISDRSLIVRHFVKKNIFTDVVPVLALTVLSFSNDSTILNELNLFLFAKIAKASNVGERFKGLIISSDKAESICNFFALLLKIFFMAHSIACLWHFVGYIFHDQNPNERNWIKTAAIVDETWDVKYLYSIYWAITTMLTVGYGDIIPTNNAERLFNIWAMFIGCGMFGYTMNSIGEIIKFSERKHGELKLKIIINKLFEIAITKVSFREQMNKVTHMMRGKNLPLETQSKVKKYLEFVWKQDRREDPEHENYIMSKLTSKLRDEIFFHTHVKFLKSVPAFKGFSDKTLIQLASFMKRVRYSPEEFIYREGEQEDICLYFVIEGKLSLINERPLGPPIIWKHYKEKFSHIKDLELLYNEHNQYRIDCLSCGFNDHFVNNCKYLRYEPVKLMLIGKYNACKRLFAKGFKRKRQKSNALVEKNEYTSFLNDFMLMYNDDDDFNELKTLYSDEERERPYFNQSPELLESQVEENSEKSLNAIELGPQFSKTTSSHRNLNTYTSKKLERKQTEFDYAKLTKEPNNNRKLDRSVNLKETRVSKSATSSLMQPELREKTPTNTGLDLDRLKSFLYYFPNNNVENLLLRVNKQSLIN